MARTREHHRAVVCRGVAVAAAALILTASGMYRTPVRAATIIRVPEDYRTVQAAIDAASAGDVVSVAAGRYFVNVTLDVGITLRGRSYSADDPRQNTTILDGRGATVVTIPSDVTPAPAVVGLVIANGDDGVAIRSPARVTHSSFVGGVSDSIDYELGGGGLALNNVFVGSGDDAIDIDHLTRDVRLLHNDIRRSGDDGIEIRLHDEVIVKTADVLIRGNSIAGSDEDGIQVIDYYTQTNRRLFIKRNLIRDSVMAGIGLMDNAETVEDYRGASILEPIHVFHNTLVRNDHGISGGGRLIAVNNILHGHVLALKNVNGESVAAFNLLWNNDVGARNSTVRWTTGVYGAPLLGADYQLQAGSPAIDAGIARFWWNGEVVLDTLASAYDGAAPDLGWAEHGQ